MFLTSPSQELGNHAQKKNLNHALIFLSRYWIPKLKKLVKKVRRNCHGCKRFQAMAYAAHHLDAFQSPVPKALTHFKWSGSTTLVHCDIVYQDNEEGRPMFCYMPAVLHGGVYLDLLPSLETEECLTSLKKFIGRRGRPERIYSDNGRTFVDAAKWVKAVVKDERLHNYLSVN